MNGNTIDTDRNNAYNANTFDPTSQSGLITLNPNYIPTERLNSYKSSSFALTPPGYAETRITIIYNGVSSISIPILFVGDVSESWSSNFVKESPVGSTYPIVAFSNTNASQISLIFHALSDYLPGGFLDFPHYINEIRKMVKPLYSGDDVIAPEIACSLPGFSFLGSCDNLNVTYSQIYGKNSYVHAQISCTFTVTNVTNN